MRVLAVLLPGLALGACAGLPPVPSHGGPAWRELESDHFVVRTDLESDDARETIEEMEHLFAGLMALGWKTRGELPGKLTTIVFEDADDVEHFAPGFAGFAFSRWSEGPLAVMSAPSRLEGTETLVHELTHQISYLALPRQPPWFAEGIATFFETAAFDAQGRFVLGRVPRDRHQLLTLGRMRTAQLMDDDVARDDPMFYSSAWLLVHYLMLRHGDAFAAYQEALAHGERSRDAWEKTLGGLTPERLDLELARYFERGAFEGVMATVPRPAVRAIERPLRDADVYALRASLYGRCFGCEARDARVQANIDSALAAEEDHLPALLFLWERATRREERLALARRAVAAHPDSWRAWLCLGWAFFADTGEVRGPMPEEASHALDRAQALAPKEPFVILLGAARAGLAGDADEALRLSARALRARPADAGVLGMRASILASAGRCVELREVVMRLANVAHGSSPDVARTTKLLARCTPTAMPTVE